MAQTNHSPLGQTLKVFVGAAIVLVLLNYQYTAKQLGYLLSRPPKPAESAAPTPAPAKIEPNTLVIEGLGIRAPIIYVGVDDEKVFQKALAGGVVHFPDTAAIGQPGNAYIFGHSSDYLWKPGTYKTVFALLPKIQVGDKIIVSNQESDAFIYVVRETRIVSPKETNFLYGQDKNRKRLTLQTSYPLGTALKRYLVIAELE